MIQLAYTSTSSWAYSETDVDNILQASRRNNARDEITGVLLYRAGTVLQILEGPGDPVRTLYAVLGRDLRHHSLFCLYQEAITQRQFPEWTMGFQLIGTFGDPPTRDPLVLPAWLKEMPPPSGRAGTLLTTFLNKIR